MTRPLLAVYLLALSLLACSLQPSLVLTTPQLHQYERTQFTASFVRHNFGEAHLAPQIDATKQGVPTEDR